MSTIYQSQSNLHYKSPRIIELESPRHQFFEQRKLLRMELSKSIFERFGSEFGKDLKQYNIKQLESILEYGSPHAIDQVQYSDDRNFLTDYKGRVFQPTAVLNDEDFNDDKKDAGEMGAGHTVTALYELIPAGSDEKAGSIDPLKYQKNSTAVKPDPNAELLTIKLRYKEPDGLTSKLFENPVKGKILDLSSTTDHFRFSAAVAEFGLLLRESEFKANSTIEDVIQLALGSKGEDEEGYRSEFIKLVKTADTLIEMRAEK